MVLNQLEASGVVGKRVQFDYIVSAFFRQVGDQAGKVFFGFKRHGRGPTYHFPVQADGTVSRKDDGSTMYPTTAVEMINPADLGITELKWA